ncbi:hypothetical protein VNO80_22150 [Phaseolus coccineus]|uniref:Reverse transcriptase domain-containing protein n=1 Tax=Phaseolus coccineus TaxID=3886 RepID=A0AAN9QU03_PHACN
MSSDTVLSSSSSPTAAVNPSSSSTVAVAKVSLSTRPVPSIIQPPSHELKPLLDQLNYAYLENGEQLPLIISIALTDEQEQKLLQILDVVKKEVTKLLQAGIIYPISNSTWVSLIQVVPKKFGIIVIKNEHDELIPIRVQNNWRVCIDYRRLNQATRKDHFPLPFIDQMLECLAGKTHYCFLDGFSGYFQICIA